MAGIIGNCLAASAHSAAAGPGYGCTAVSRCQDTVSFDACGAWQSEDTHPSRNGWPAGPSESRSQCMAFPRPAPVLLRHCCVQAGALHMLRLCGAVSRDAHRCHQRGSGGGARMQGSLSSWRRREPAHKQTAGSVEPFRFDSETHALLNRDLQVGAHGGALLRGGGARGAARVPLRGRPRGVQPFMLLTLGADAACGKKSSCMQPFRPRLGLLRYSNSTMCAMRGHSW